jgi:nitric-oxide synthase
MLDDKVVRSNPLLRRLRRSTPSERAEEAADFIRAFYRENGLSDEARRTREAEVSRSLRLAGVYEHTPEELAFGARVAWRNHSRCIGRLVWSSLKVVDCRDVADPDEIAARIVDHMSAAFGAGRIKPMISIFAPVKNGVLPSYVESYQIIQYAGYSEPDGSVLGDRLNIETTRDAIALGWRPPDVRGMFDVLPFVIRTAGGKRLLYQLPDAAIREVEIRHPDFPAIDELGLRWYAVPCVSNMILTLGGLDYPCAPFSGFYMGTEIASRDFGDKLRYDLLPKIATAIGSPPGRDVNPFWIDRALVEINYAVVDSFQKAGVTILDHHAASDQYMEFNMRELAAGRRPSANWSWIVPPQASSACPVFHLPMEDLATVPNYYSSRATDGANLMPHYLEESRSRLQRRWDRIKRRLRRWRRERF